MRNSRFMDRVRLSPWLLIMGLVWISTFWTVPVAAREKQDKGITPVAPGAETIGGQGSSSGAGATQGATPAGSLFDLGPVIRDEGRLWTVMVYIDADNNLEPFGLADVSEMARDFPAKGVEVLVLIDRAEGYSQEAGDWKDARLYRLIPNPGGPAKGELLAQPGELNMGDPAVLRSFVAGCLRTFPAKRHALVLWDHGGGWAGHVTDEKAPGVRGEFDKLTLPELRSALSGALQDAGIPKLDLVGFDMCLMAQIETAYELEGLADVMVASEAPAPGDGWPYDKVIPLFARPGLSAADIGKGIVGAFDDFYRAREEQMATHSAFDLGKVSNLVKCLNTFMGRLETTLPDTWPAFTRTLFFSDGFGDLSDVRRGRNALSSIDLGDAITNLVHVHPELESTSEHKALREAMRGFVLENKASRRHARCGGVAIYAPFRRDLLNKDYTQTRFGRDSRWIPTLERLYGHQEKNPTRPRITSIQTYSLLRQKEVPDVLQLGQDGFRFSFDGRNVLWSFVFLGMRDQQKPRTLVYQKSILRKESSADQELKVKKKGRLELLKDYTHEDGPHQVGFRYDGSRWMVSNGEKAVMATMDESDVNNLGSYLIAVPAIYEHPKVGKLGATLYFNWLWRATAVLLEVPQKDGSHVLSRVNPQPDANIHLLMEAVSDNGERTYVHSGTLKWKDGLTLIQDLAPPGSYEVILSIESLSGQAQTAKHRFQVNERDDLKEALRTGPEELIPENFIGEWEYLDAEKWNKEGRMVSIGAFATYEPHPKAKGVLNLTLYKPRGKNIFPGMNIVYVLQPGGLPLLRQYVLDQEGYPDPAFGFRMTLPIFDYKDGQYFCWTMDLSTGEMQIMVKRSGPTPKLKTQATAPAQPAFQAGPGAQTPQAAPPAPAVPGGTPTGLDGAWQSSEGETVVFQANQWAYYEGGKMVDGGIYQIQQNQIMTQSQYSGEVLVYLFQVRGDQLLLQDSFGEVHQFVRAR